MRRLLQTTALTAIAVVPFGALADDTALVLGNERYELLDRLSRGSDVVRAVDGIADLGFDVIALPNGRAETTADALADFLDQAADAGRLIVALSGRFATDGARTWFLTADAPAPGILSLGPEAVPVESLLAVLGRAPGGAVLLLGVEADADTVFDPWLRQGIGDLDIPQGVTVLTGGPRVIADFLATDMAEPGGDLSALVTENGRIRADGFLPSGYMFMPTEAPVVIVEPQPDAVDPAIENTFWQGTVALDTVDAYRNYLRRYPTGRFADDAEQAIADIIAEPNRDARQTEESLNLTRDQRRDIQRNLTLLSFNTRGVDGIFGGATRSAITNWQQQNGFPQTGYLTAEQINRIDAQAARRSAQLEAEAARQQQIAAQADRAFWDETGARGDEAGLRAYLDRYPDGLFADTASQQLRAIEVGKRQQAQAADRAAWDTARSQDTIASYRAYLRAYPQGAFRSDAEQQVERLIRQRDSAAEIEAARATEQSLELTRETARIVEVRLADLGLEPGEIDGSFDGESRRAIRNYQRDRSLPVTGYLDETTLVRLLVDSTGIIPLAPVQ